MCKKIVLVIISVFLLSGCLLKTTGQATDLSEKTDEYFHLDGEKIYGSYFAFASLGGRPLERTYINNADFNTFKALGGGYAKDKSAVYLYARDIMILKDANPDSFVYVGEEFAKDKNKVYFRDKIIVGADPVSFQIIDKYFSRDNQNVYLYQFTIADADPGSFEVLSWTEARDKNHLYKVDMNTGEVFIK